MPPRIIAIKAIILHNFGVQVGFRGWRIDHFQVHCSLRTCLRSEDSTGIAQCLKRLSKTPGTCWTSLSWSRKGLGLKA